MTPIEYTQFAIYSVLIVIVGSFIIGSVMAYLSPPTYRHPLIRNSDALASLAVGTGGWVLCWSSYGPLGVTSALDAFVWSVFLPLLAALLAGLAIVATRTS